MIGVITIVEPGGQLLVQDEGRPGRSAIGVPRSGAFDAAAASLAQRLVGNPAAEAGLELLLGGARLRVSRPVTAVVTGAEVPLTVGGRAVAVAEVFSWPAGAELRLGRPSRGLRNYLAVRGGLAVPPVVGSRATDVLSGLGPEPLRAGVEIALAGRSAGEPLVPAGVPRPATGPLRVLLGPRDDLFADAAVELLLGEEFRVSPDSNRIGIRLTGPRLPRIGGADLPSEPLQRGALQVPPSGLPIIMGPDHPTTGGYPVIATVVSADWDRCGQLRPGEAVRFVLDRQFRWLAD